MFSLHTVKCYATSTQNKSIECANGSYGKIWNGCINQGSVRVRCPIGTFPCNDLAGNGLEFSCRTNCLNYGGLRKCLNDGADSDITCMNINNE